MGLQPVLDLFKIILFATVTLSNLSELLIEDQGKDLGKAKARPGELSVALGRSLNSGNAKSGSQQSSSRLRGQVQHHYRTKYQLGIEKAIAIAVLLSATPSHAQLIPDNSLGTDSSQVLNSIASDGTPQSVIEQGALRGNNLFHSFDRFDLSSSEAAYFVNPAGVTQIFTRITGQSPSQVNGTLGVLGDADLFLLNPNGLVFGPNARLDLAGSFMGSTAQQVQFADGLIFGTSQPDLNAPLSLSGPVGLQMGQQAGAIQVQGFGHRLVAEDAYLSPFLPNAIYEGLQVAPEQTLALLGEDLKLTGGILQAPGGRIELGAVAQPGLIRLQALTQGWSLSYPEIQQFGSIDLTQKASVETGGLLPGHIQIQGGAIALGEASVISNENLGPNQAGNITINATERLDLAGLDLTALVPTQIRLDNFGSGPGGAMLIRSPQINVRSGAVIGSRTFGLGTGGELSLATESLNVQGYAEQAADAFSRVTTLAMAPGEGGGIRLLADNLNISDGGYLGSAVLQGGVNGGDLWIESDRVALQGGSPAGFVSGLGANHLSSSGRSGNLTLNTRTLEILGGAFLSTTSLNGGNAGDLQVNAQDAIVVSGRSQDQSTSSVLASAVYTPTEILKQLFGVPDVPSGAGGNLRIKTPSLAVKQGGLVTVSNLGLGRAGILQLDAQKILIQQNGSISAFTLSGNGGNLEISAEQLSLIDRSEIIAAALGDGNNGDGGNISITTSVLLGADDSNILASAQQGRGGNIDITTEGLFGLEFRPQETPGNDINASSELGLNGMVQVETVTLEPTPSRVELEQTPIDVSQLVVAGCSLPEASKFTLSGKGGLPTNPRETLVSGHLWQDIPSSRSAQTLPPSKSFRQTLTRSQLPVMAPKEVTTWKQLASGSVELLAEGTMTTSPNRRENCGVQAVL